MAEKIRVMVVEDVLVQRLLMKRLVESHASLEWIGEADDAHRAMEMIATKQPDVLLLDVQIPGMSGVQLLAGLQEPPKVVFASAWPSYAVEAFALDAVDYLLKPVTPERFATTVRRLERIFHGGIGPLVRHESMDRICLRTTERTLFLPIHKIAALRADGDFTWVHETTQPPILACRRLGEFDELLPSLAFARLDRSLIINLERLVKVERPTRNTAQVWLRGMTEPLEVGRTASERLLEIMKRKTI